MPSPGPASAPFIPILEFTTFSGIPHGIGTRHGGVSPSPFESLNMSFAVGDDAVNVRENRRRLASRLGAGEHDVVAGQLSHGSDVSVFHRGAPEERSASELTASGESPRSPATFPGDGVVSDVPGLFFLLTFADCVPLVFSDQGRGAIGAAHAGWRGTALGMAAAMVQKLHAEFGSEPHDLKVGIGPSIGPCCYVIGEEVLDAIRANGLEAAVETRDGELRLDLWATTELQLRKAGVPAHAIENPLICTACNVSRFFSHRAEQGRTGRFALCVGLDRAS